MIFYYQQNEYKWKQRNNLKKYEELKSKIREVISSITKNSDDYDEKYIKVGFKTIVKFKTTKICSMEIVVTAVFYKNGKYYPQFFLDEFLYKLWII